MDRVARGLRTLVVVVIVAAAGFVTLRGQREVPESGDMKALVAEVRALRLAIERTAASTSQSQLLLGRVQLQENRLTTLSRQYLEARTRMLDEEKSQVGLEQELRQMVTRSETAGAIPLEERQAIEERIVHLKIEVARQKARTDLMRSDEAAAANVLSTEQQRWADFNARLEDIERTLSRDATRP
jgi:hypothetical protein